MNRKDYFQIDTTRYAFDFKYCTYAKGWAQVDTPQDAWYFGVWTNPTSLKIITHAEGDTTVISCDNSQEYAAEVSKACDFYSAKIDAGCKQSIVEKITNHGLSEYLY